MDSSISNLSDVKLSRLISSMETNGQLFIPELKHDFADRLYARTLFMPAGSVMVGKVHKYSHLGILLHGHVLVYVNDQLKFELKAPYITSGEPGTRRVFYAVTDSLWTAVINTELTDPDEIESEVTLPSMEAYKQFLLERGD